MNTILKNFSLLFESELADYWTIDSNTYPYMELLNKLFEQDGMVVFSLSNEGRHGFIDRQLMNHYFSPNAMAYPTEWEFVKLSEEEQFAKLSYKKTFLVTDVAGRPLYLIDFNNTNGHVAYFRDANNEPAQPTPELNRLLSKLSLMQKLIIPDSADFQPFLD